MDPIVSLSDLLAEQKTATAIEIPGRIARTFGQTTFSTTMTASKLLSVYEVDLEVQRSIIPQNLSKLIDYITLYLDHRQAIYFPGILLSARGAGQLDEENQMFRLEPIEKLYVVDGQHRLAAIGRLIETLQSQMARAKDRREYDKMEEMTEKLNRLYHFPMSVMIYVDIHARQERQLFSDINKLPRKIGGNLALLRDQRRFYHVLASELAAKDPLMQQIGVDVFSERGKSPEYLFSYHLLVEISVALLEGRLKSGARNNGYYFTDSELEHGMATVAHYFQRLQIYLPEPAKGELSWSENVQIAMALFFHGEAVKTGKFNRYSLEHAMDILKHVKWDAIYAGDEKDRLPRRSRIMKAYQYLKDFYDNNQLLLDTTNTSFQKESAQGGDN